MSISTFSNRAQILKQKFTNSIGLPFESVLSVSQIEQEMEELSIKYKTRLFTPIVTLWAFLSQVLDVDKSCHNAVSRVIAWLAASSAEIPSTDTSAYCQARKRLPEKLLENLFKKSGESLESKVKIENLWCGRHVQIIDCSTVSMPDTPSNQKAYPQSVSQKEGCGFPLAKIGALFSLATGAATALVIDVLNINDIKLARILYQFLNPKDVLLGDRAFFSYTDFFWIIQQDCDIVVRQNNSRSQRLKGGIIVGTNDEIITWTKPKYCPKAVKKEEFYSLPEILRVRQISYLVNVPGFRTQSIRIITTLLNKSEFSTDALIELYQKRWHVEVDLRHLKTSLGMDILRSKTPDMVRKEIYAFLLAYNLLRSLMFDAATAYNTPTLRISLQGTRHHFINFCTQFLSNSRFQFDKIYRTLLKVIVHKIVPDRPNRVEPRVLKRRSKSFPYMSQPRPFLRNEMQYS